MLLLAGAQHIIKDIVVVCKTCLSQLHWRAPRSAARIIGRMLLKSSPDYATFAALESARGEGEDSAPDVQQ